MKIVTIGRASTNDVALPDMSVSREHAKIVQADNGTYTITDCNSRNGTYVNGQRIYGSVPLGENDFVRIGENALPWKQYFMGSGPMANNGYAGYEQNAQDVQGLQTIQDDSAPRPVDETDTSSKANVFAILGFVFSFLFLIAILGLIFSIIGLNKSKEMGDKGKGFAVAGMIISIISMALSFIIIVATS